MVKKKETEKVLLSWINADIPENIVFTNVENGIELPLILKVLKNIQKPAVVIFPLLSEAENALEMLQVWGDTLKQDSDFILLPETIKGQKYIPENEALRAKVINQAIFDENSIFIGSVSGAFSQIPDPDELISSSFELSVGEKISINDLINNLLELDYDDEWESSVPGEYSRRGGIVDIFSPSSDYPLCLWKLRSLNSSIFFHLFYSVSEYLFSIRYILKEDLPGKGEDIESLRRQIPV